jgi:hypothetical protein
MAKLSRQSDGLGIEGRKQGRLLRIATAGEAATRTEERDCEVIKPP